MPCHALSPEEVVDMWLERAAALEDAEGSAAAADPRGAFTRAQRRGA